MEIRREGGRKRKTRKERWLAGIGSILGCTFVFHNSVCEVFPC